MDDINPNHINTVSLPAVKLDKTQTALYKSNCLEIYDAEGNSLECIGKRVQQDDISLNDHRMYNQIYLVESLMDTVNNCNGSIELPTKAAAAMVDLLCRMEGFCARHIK